ncbi:uncharacterized protein LOC115767654 [Drosophila novamexicana]|uniref:uncharacterized protein LOC115767654 n=1 Tax=Drosophila novamexicana TaxID=47314 RepID=UPI0011E5AD1F|nr:uncharacterized protein LOC115767654 [Drosophila novamexicana]XP_030567801.1 uncharacterized protein LOC115767654 [Drosophila novamexicana]
MTSTSSAGTCGVSIGHQLAILIVLLSIASQLSPGHALPRPTVGALPTQMLFNELLSSGPGNEDNTYYGEQLKYQQQQQQLQPKQMPSFNYFVNKWPSLRDLLLTADYDDDSVLPMESVERERAQLASRLLARLHRLGDNGDGLDAGDDQPHYNILDDMSAMPTKKQSEGVKLSSSAKQHNIKKNVQFRKQYMSPCHFKICNMGRKRNSGSFVSY